MFVLIFFGSASNFYGCTSCRAAAKEETKKAVDMGARNLLLLVYLSFIWCAHSESLTLKQLIGNGKEYYKLSPSTQELSVSFGSSCIYRVCLFSLF